MAFKLSKRFIAALLAAASLVVPDYRNPDSWMTAIGIVIAAASTGATSSQSQTAPSSLRR